MADPIELLQALLIATTFVVGMLLIANGIEEDPHRNPPEPPG